MVKPQSIFAVILVLLALFVLTSSPATTGYAFATGGETQILYLAIIIVGYIFWHYRYKLEK